MDSKDNEFNKPIVYQIKIRGRLKGKWADWFNGWVVKIDHPVEGLIDTTIHLSVPDQAALRGVVNKIWDLNLTLISVNLSNEGDSYGGASEH